MTGRLKKLKGIKISMKNKHDYIFYHCLKNTPIGTHQATLTDVNSFHTEDDSKPYISVTFYIESLDRNFTYCFKKSNSFLSKHVAFLNMLKKATNKPFSDINDLIGECFIITISVSPHYDEKKEAYTKITDIKPGKEVK